jgi:hypothetical protein
MNVPENDWVVFRDVVKEQSNCALVELRGRYEILSQSFGGTCSCMTLVSKSPRLAVNEQNA